MEIRASIYFWGFPKPAPHQVIPTAQQAKLNSFSSLCTFPLQISLRGFTRDRNVLTIWHFWVKFGMHSLALTQWTSSSRLLGEAAQTAAAFGKRDFLGGWSHGLFFSLGKSNQHLAEKRKSEVPLISNTLCKDCYQAFQKYLNFLLGSNFCFL